MGHILAQNLHIAIAYGLHCKERQQNVRKMEVSTVIEAREGTLLILWGLSPCGHLPLKTLLLLAIVVVQYGKGVRACTRER